MSRAPLFLHSVQAGFPSPADDYAEEPLNIGDYLVTQPAATFYVRASGKSMVNAGILDGALLVVNRSRAAKDGDVVIAALDGEITCKILDARAQLLRSANLDYPAIPVHEGAECRILGVVTHAINPLCSHW